MGTGHYLVAALAAMLAPAAGTDLADALKRDYDLKPKYRKGDTRFYRLRIVYNRLDPQGRIASRSEHRGDFERRVESVEPGGKAYERITWRNAAVREAQGGAEFGAADKLPWLEGFSYRFSAEDPHRDFPWNYDRFPPNMTGYLSLVMVIDAHFEFDYLRSSYHGAIEKLRRIGDEVEAPDSHQPFALNMPPLIPSSHLQKRNVYTKFLGLTHSRGEPCAILAHRQGPGRFRLDFAAGPEQRSTEVTSTFSGNLIVRLSDGSLTHGDFVEWVASSTPVPGRETPVYRYTRADYNLDEISGAEYTGTRDKPAK